MAILEECGDAIDLVYRADEAVVNCGCFKFLAGIEDLALQAAASPDYVQSFLYCAVVRVGDEFLVRYAASHCFKLKNEQ